MSSPKKVIIILGPTASGKTSMAVRLCREIKGEIISADSRQLFREMTIGSGKDLDEYGEIPYHLIDILDAGEEFSVSDFQQKALEALMDITNRGVRPVICGGTGHYVKALIEDYQFDFPKSDLARARHLESLNREALLSRLRSLDQNHPCLFRKESKRRLARAIEKLESSSFSSPRLTTYRKNYNHLMLYIETQRSQISARIKARLERRLQHGLIQEVETLSLLGISDERLERYGLEYKWVSYFLAGKITRERLFEKLYTEIRRYAKRQMTFIRYLEKSGHQPIAIENYDHLSREVKRFLSH
jgi:tRNA dimethylallyltransferase